MSNFVGQASKLEFLQSCADNGKFPRFIILYGPEHFGKRTMANHIAKNIIKSQPAVTEPSIQGVRDVIATAYKAMAPTCYIFPDCDKMTTAAQNALLKVTEEPPKQAYFILTTSSSILETLKSRATNISLSHYTKKELRNFTDDEIALNICYSPGTIELLGNKSRELYDFCVNVVNSIAQVTGVNAFKIPGYLQLKEGQEGYNLQMFFLGFRYAALQKVHEQLEEVETKPAEALVKCINVTSKYQSMINRKSVRKDSLLDMWVLEIRGILKGE